MRSSHRLILAAALALPLAASLSCEDTDVTAPSGSTITLTAQPQAVFIDQAAGENTGSTTLSATVVDENGLPLASIPLFFTANGGLLASVDNFCTQAGVCSRSGDPCSGTSDCPMLPAATIQTNQNGQASDSLTLRLIEDPSQVTVTVKGTNLEASTQVVKNVNLGPIDPQAVISATPSGGQRGGINFSLDGTDSTFDPQVELECFEWQIESDVDVFESTAAGCQPCVLGAPSCTDLCVERGEQASIITLKIGETGNPETDADLSVTLFVSDEPDIDCANPDPGDFSIFGDTIAYQIRCDFTPPILAPIADKSGDLAQQSPVPINLSASAFDQEDATLKYIWECGTTPSQGDEGDNLASFTCVYDQTGTFTGSVTVQNDCGQIAQDGFTVTIINTD